MATGDGPFCRICGHYGHTEHTHGTASDLSLPAYPAPPDKVDSRPIEERIQDFINEIPASEWKRFTLEEELRKRADTFLQYILKMFRQQDAERKRMGKFMDLAEDLLIELSNHSIEGKLFQRLEMKLWKDVHWFREHGFPYKPVQRKEKKTK